MRAVLFLAVMLASQLAPPLVSPDGAWMLVGSEREPQLWLENKRTNAKWCSR